MANTFTSTDSGSLGTSLVVQAYDKLVEFALRSQPMLRSVSDKRPVNVTSPGTSVTFQIYNDLAVATTALTETTDPDAVGIPSTSSVSVTLNEYGNVALVTRKLQLTSLTDVDPGIANILAYNMADSIDDWRVFSEIMFLLLGGTGVGYSVQKHHVEALPEIRKPNADKTRRFLIGDSIEGWADAISVIVKAYFFGGSKPVFDFRDIRPKGARLITSGGKAPGPQPLKLE